MSLDLRSPGRDLQGSGKTLAYLLPLIQRRLAVVCCGRFALCILVGLVVGLLCMRQRHRAPVATYLSRFNANLILPLTPPRSPTNINAEAHPPMGIFRQVV